MIPSWFPADQFEELRVYHDLYKIAEGGFGEVYLAGSPEQGDKIIVKRLKPGAAENAAARESFHNEAGFLKKIGHPQFPFFLNGYFSEKEFFFLMQYVPGLGVDRLIKHAKASGLKFPAELALEISLQVCGALHYLHHYRKETGELTPIVHGDLKPHNLIVTPELKVVLVDFSVASHLTSEKKTSGGTLRYLPPEGLSGDPTSFQTDLFGLMLTLYEMLAKTPLFDNKSMKLNFLKLVSKDYLKEIEKKNFPEPLEKILLKGLAYHPEERFESAEALEKALQECIKNLGVPMEKTKLREQLENLSKIR